MSILDFFKGKKNPTSAVNKNVVAEYQRGLQLLKSGRKDSVMQGYDIIGPLAAGGYVEAQMTMGDFCENILQRFEQAAEWYRRAAEQGHPQGLRCYADMLMIGRGVPKNIPLAFTYYEKAANKGVAESQFVMGEKCRNEGNREKAMEWYKKSFNNGYQPAEIRIQQMKNNIR